MVKIYKSKKDNRDECKLQAQCIRYLKLKKLTAWHTANESKSKVQYRSKLKTKGVMAGVSDIIILGKTMAFIELKTKSGLSTQQKEFLEVCCDADHFTAVCYSFDDFVECVDDYLRECYEN